MCFLMFCYRDGYVYFAQMENTGPIKIGFSNDPYSRIANLNTSSPYPIKLLYFTPACRDDEKELHRVYYRYNIRNEWFHPHESIFKLISYRKEKDIKERGFDWLNPNTERDLGDWTLPSERWDEEWIVQIHENNKRTEAA